MVSIDMDVTPDLWLSETLSRPAYKVVLVRDSLDDREEIKKFLASQVSNAFVSCKIPTSFLQSAHVLESMGFRLIDTNVIFEKSLSREQYPATQANIQFAVPEDERSIVELAGKSFQCSRFHLDPRIRKEVANHIKAEWVRNYFLGKRGQWLITAKVDEVDAGFLLLLNQARVLTIDLIAVDPAHQRRGIARSMISYAETHCGSVDRIRVGTQVANIPSVNLYEKMGFQLVDSHYVFHYHPS